MRGTDAGKALAALIAAFVIVCGVLYLPRHHLYLQPEAYADFFQRLPATLELIIASVIVAFALAGICTLLSRGKTAWLGALAAAVLSIFLCIPVFWLAPVAQLVLAVMGVHVFSYVVQFPAAGIGQPYGFDFRDVVVHLLVPAMLLALVQAGAYVNALRDGISGRRFLAAFAVMLPAIVSADVLIEIFFAWPGVGRAFYSEAEPHNTSFMVAFLLLSAAAIVITRTLARVVRAPDAVEVFEPL